MIELVQRLKNAELGNQRLAAGGRQTHHHSTTTGTKQTLFCQCTSLRRQDIKQRLVTSSTINKAADEFCDARIDCSGDCPDGIVGQLSRRCRQQTGERFQLKSRAVLTYRHGTIKMHVQQIVNLKAAINHSVSDIDGKYFSSFGQVVKNHQLQCCGLGPMTFSVFEVA